MSYFTVERIFPKNAIAMRKVEKLLKEQGIRLDKNLDYICGIYDQQRNLIATGSSFQNTLRCLAVSCQHQGEGLMNTIISHLVSHLYQKGFDHLFLYTKPDATQSFDQLGFVEILNIDDYLSFMENKKDGFEHFLQRLQSTPANSTKNAAIVMNANPFTLGHLHLIEKAAAENETVHLFLLEEDASFFPYSVRKRLVEAGTKHLENIIIQPTSYYIISQATFPSYFQKDEQSVIDSHALLDAKLFTKIAEHLNITKRYVGEEPFSEMTRRYNQAMRTAFEDTNLILEIIPRKEVNGKVISGSKLRVALIQEDWKLIETFVPETTFAFLKSEEAKPIIETIKQSEDVVHH